MKEIKIDEDFILIEKNKKYSATVIINKFGLPELFINGRL